MGSIFRRFGQVIALAVVPALADAAGQPFPTPSPDSWEFSLLAYAYLPRIEGSTYFPINGTNQTFALNEQDILDHLKLTFMGSFDVHRGIWGVFVDVLYLDLGERKTNFADFTISRVPGSLSSDVSLDMKSWVVTTAAEFRALNSRELTIDSFGGIRYLYLKEALEWNLTGTVGSLPPAVRAGNAEISDNYYDGIVGVKGQYRFGAERRWTLPVYVDLGAGSSHFTWQAAAGIGYAFHWGEVAAVYRYIDWQLSSTGLRDLSIGGPMVGAKFRW